jgi:hypothetical protein
LYFHNKVSCADINDLTQKILSFTAKVLNKHCIPRIAQDTEINISSLDYQAELTGAAALVMEDYDKLDLKSEKNYFNGLI